MKESDLARPVADWLREKKYTVYSEVPFFSRCIDMVGVKGKKIIVVELKLICNLHVIKQAAIAQLATHDVYVAVATNPRRQSLARCMRIGLGVLCVGDNVQVLQEPRCKYEPAKTYADHLIENAQSNAPSDNAGVNDMATVLKIMRLNKRIKQLELAVKEWRGKADWQLDTIAQLQTKLAHKERQFKQLEADKKELKEKLKVIRDGIQFYGHCNNRTKQIDTVLAEL